MSSLSTDTLRASAVITVVKKSTWSKYGHKKSLKFEYFRDPPTAILFLIGPIIPLSQRLLSAVSKQLKVRTDEYGDFKKKKKCFLLHTAHRLYMIWICILVGGTSFNNSK
jgi:hypothetical protein